MTGRVVKLYNFLVAAMITINHRFLHEWDITPSQALHLQEKLRNLASSIDDFGSIETVAGVDVGFDKERDRVRAAIAVLRLPDLHLTATAAAERPATFPYVPGLLSFREIPAILDALADLDTPPNLLLCDGQGIAHPRRFGIACHLGVLTGLPTIGVAKSRLIGKHDAVPEQKGGWVELFDRGEIIGAVLRTRRNVKPLFISPGHKISLASSIEYVMRCTTRYKLPETTRAAHRLAAFSKDSSSPTL